MKVHVPHDMWLRPVEDGDHEWLVELHNDPDVLRNLTHPQPITLAQHLAWWNRVKDDAKQLRQVFVIDGDPVGFTKFYDIDRANSCCVLGADIHRTHRGQGLAKYMWTLMLEHCFDNLKLHRVGLTTAAYNAVGQRVYLGLGFKEEGRLEQSLYRDGQFHDQICMRMLSIEWASR